MPNKKRIRQRIQSAKDQQGENHAGEFEKQMNIRQELLDSVRAVAGPQLQNVADLGIANAKANKCKEQLEYYKKMKEIQNEETMVKTLVESLKIQANGGKLEEAYGDGDQSLVYGNESILLRSQWSSGADYDPGRLSLWGQACLTGQLMEVRKFVEKDQTILDYRESILRICGLMHVIIGARCLVDPPASTDHKAVMEYLISAGADIQSRDFAGHSPLHHCLTATGNDRTFELAKILLKHGADPNAINRFGATPLSEPALSGNLKFVKLLLDHGAKINIKDNDGCMPVSLGHLNPKLHAMFSEHGAKLGKAQKAAAKANSNYRKCALCGVDRKCSRCSGCFVRWYCTAECQKQDWKCHRSECKNTQAEYKKVTLLTTDIPGKMSILSNLRTRTLDSPKLDLTKKQHFVVKLSIPLDAASFPGDEKEKGHILIYDKHKYVLGFIPSTDENYDDIVNVVQEKGVSGIKGYFYAVLKDNEVKVNISKIQPPEDF